MEDKQAMLNTFFLWGALDLFWTLLAVRGFLGLSWGLSRDYRKVYGLSWDYREISWDRCFFGHFGASLVFPWVSGPRADNIATKCPKALGDGCFFGLPRTIWGNSDSVPVGVFLLDP